MAKEEDGLIRMAVRQRATTSLSVKQRRELLKTSKRECDVLIGFSVMYLLGKAKLCSTTKEGE